MLRDLEEHALWHLELLGCFEPGDAMAPWVPPPEFDHEHGGWDDDDGEYLGHVTCWRCEDGTIIDCCDDLCHGQGWCMHGGNRTCPNCHGEGYC